MADVIGGCVILLAVGTGIWWLCKAIFGKCNYCGSEDIVPDEGLFFYCNNCKRKS